MNKICQNCKQNFTIEPEDFVFYEKIYVPAPTFCPECREQRRLAFRNERSLYKRKCDLCQKEVVSIYSPMPPSGWAKPFTVYCPDCWYSDKWSMLASGRDFDFTKLFFPQFKELLQDNPRMSIAHERVVNSDWVNNEFDSKNCYLNVGGHYNEDCAYNTYAIKCKDCFDNYWAWGSNLCYENIICRNGYRTFWSQQCFNCINTFFSYDCRNCQDIIGCAGLRNKQYYIFNKKYSKKGYFDFLKKHPVSSYKETQYLKGKAMDIILEVPHRDTFMVKSVNCNGNYIEQSKNCQNCFDVEKAEDCKHLFISAEIKDSYDASAVGFKTELVYEALSASKIYNVHFCFFIDGGYNIEYSNFLSNCHDCFGCVGLRDKSYCVFNKQYSESEYHTLKNKIIEHMKKTKEYGEFFSMSLSVFGYNETVAQNYFPLNKTAALLFDANWNDYESDIQYQFSDYQIPDDIKDVGDDILEKVLRCEVSGKAYRIIRMELKFYREMGLPIPRRAPLQRHCDRLALRAPRKFWQRHCKKCNQDIKTVYAPERPEIVYCEKCYQQEVV